MIPAADRKGSIQRDPAGDQRPHLPRQCHDQTGRSSLSRRRVCRAGVQVILRSRGSGEARSPGLLQHHGGAVGGHLVHGLPRAGIELSGIEPHGQNGIGTEGFCRQGQLDQGIVPAS